jgi:hypothetical protein
VFLTTLAGEPSQNPIDPNRQLTRQRTNSSSRSRLPRILTRRPTALAAPSEDLKGPLGLNTLFQPQRLAVADLIFVHGLGGGSKSTWTKSEDPSLYWPREWLPHDADFIDVRIHAFGYNSNWNKESTLNIHDFAKSLLGSVQDCPQIPRGSNVCACFLPPSKATSLLVFIKNP